MVVTLRATTPVIRPQSLLYVTAVLSRDRVWFEETRNMQNSWRLLMRNPDFKTRYFCSRSTSKS